MNTEGFNWSLGWVDSVGLGLVVVFSLLGIKRGLWWQIVRLVGVVAAVGLARSFAGRLSPWIGDRMPDVSESTAHGLSWFGIFLGGLVLATLLGKIGKRSLDAMQLGLVDRFGGLLAGVVTGVLLQAAMLVGLFELTSPSFSERALAGTYSERLLEATGGSNALLVDAEAVKRWRPWFLGGEPTEVQAGDGE